MTKTRDAIEDLKTLLLSGEMQTGERLPPEADLAARLGISRNVLREAVRALVHGGVLRTRQGDGTYMGPLDPSELLDGVALYTQLATGSRLLAGARGAPHDRARADRTRGDADGRGRAGRARRSAASAWPKPPPSAS